MSARRERRDIRLPLRRRDPQAGVTLVEVLVVLAVVAVMSGVAVISLGAADRSLRASTEVNRLAAQLRDASDRALLGGTVLTLHWNEEAYLITEPGAAAADWYRLPEPLRIVADPSEGALVLRPDGLGGALTLRIDAGGEGGWQVAFDGLTAQVTSVGGAVR